MVFIVILFLIMYVYGMANTYFPDPMYMGSGQYLDISVGITVIGLVIFGLILAVFFKKEMAKISNMKKI